MSPKGNKKQAAGKGGKPVKTAEEQLPIRVIARNKRAHHEYLIQEELECGVMLVGTEVKSLRGGRCTLAEAYVTLVEKRGRLEMDLIGCNIPRYSHGNKNNHEPDRVRRLLAHEREMRDWFKRVREKGITIVPLEVYFKGSLVKVKVALVKGKKLHDKRNTERERTDRRDIERELGRRR